MKKLLPLLLLTLTTSGCSIFLAARQPDKKNLTVLKEGGHKRFVVAELGKPIHTETKNNQTIETYKFIQGYTTNARVTRVIIYSMFDILTGFLTEFVTTPAEVLASGTKTVCVVTYNNEIIKNYKIIQEKPKQPKKTKPDKDRFAPWES